MLRNDADFEWGKSRQNEKWKETAGRRRAEPLAIERTLNRFVGPLRVLLTFQYFISKF